MKKITLADLKLRNFKGIKDLHLEMNGADLKIYGDNGTGKTTIFDGFLWLLFGKDSNNRADFAIKTLAGGKEINNLEHEVEATFSIDGQALTLQKIYKEKWTKKRGAPLAEFTGHETDHYIDGVPVKKKEYEEKVGSIVKEEVFKLLTNPLFFNENLKWQDRRKTLLEVCGDVDFEDVLAFNNDLKDLPTILKGRAIEDHRKVVASRRAEINKELDRIPVRISEVENSMPSSTINARQLVDEVADIEKKLDENATLINNIKNGSAINEKQNQLRQVQLDLKEIQNELEAEAVEKGFQVQAKIQEEKSNITNLRREIDSIESLIKSDEQSIIFTTKSIERIENEIVALREQWNTENELVFEHKEECECPTCGQALPEAELNAAREKAIAAFNLKKSNELERLNVIGKAKTEEKNEMQHRNSALQEKINKLVPSIEKTQSQIDSKEKVVVKLTNELNELREEVKDARQDPKYIAKLQEQEEIKAEIEKLQVNAQDAVADIEQQNAELRSKRSELNAQIAQQAHAENSKKRIAELEEQQKELATEFEELERELFLTEEFIRSKVELLEERINSKFKFARFKLFDQQINGGLQEVCETMYLGVPFSSGLNNAAKINVGIDIINTLTEHFGIQAPIFVDNAEAVTKLIDTDSQLISLVVSEPDKQLRIESQSGKESEVA